MDPTRFIMPTLLQSHLYNKPSKKRVESLYFPLYLILMNRKQKFKDHLLVIGQYKANCTSQQSRIKQIQVLGTPNEKKHTGSLNFFEKIVKIYSQASVIAIITKREEAWLLVEPFDRPVNISKLIHKKIVKVFLGQKQMVVLTKDNQYILLNWGTVKKIQKNIVKISTFNQNNQQFLFQAYLLQSVEEGTLYYYNLDKKILNSNIFYEIKGQSKEIIGYPIMNSIKSAKIVKGISVGKHHSLYWDEDGSLYSWGSRSLALGYGELPSDNVIEEPHKIEISKKVLMAFAATHYSLALTSQGLIYQWGIKMQVNHLNEDPIFYPRPLQFKYFNCKAKFISLKGKDNNFAALSSNNHLYVWGHDAKSLINPSLQLPDDWKGNYLYEPVLQTDLLGCKILDFSIESEFLSVVTGNQDVKQEQIEQYWKVLRQKARFQLAQFKTNRIQTQNSECYQFIDQIRNKYKKNSIVFAKCLQKKVVTPRILQQNSIKNHRSQRKKSQQADIAKLNPFKATTPVLSANFWPQLSNHKRQISDCFGSTSPVFKQNLRCSQIVSFGNSNSTTRQKSLNDKKVGSYSNRLQTVLQKKKMMEQEMMAAHLKKIDESSLQFRLKKKQQQIEKQKKLQCEEIMKVTLGKFIFKIYLSNMLRLSADEGRRVKIVNFKRTLVLNRVQKNIKRLFFQSKIKFALQSLQKQNFTRFSILNLYFRRYVHRFRARRRRNTQKMITQSIVKYVAKQKFHVGIFQIRKKVMKIQKVGQWIHIYNKQRMRILKELWNNFLLLTLKISDGNQIILQSSLNSQATFAQKLSQARKERKITSLLNYYKCPIRRRSKRTTQNQMLAENKRKNMRLFEGLKDKLFHIQILPYSLHYNYFKRPKNMDIVINQGLKVSSSWTETERKAQGQLLRRIIRKNDLEFIAKRRKYQVDLANYLRNKYDTFYELRWKFIIEYNKTEKTLEKRMKQKQLRRILKLIGMEKLVDQDCIPEKHLVLEQALKRRDVPTPPSSIIVFDIHKFQNCYKAYWQFLHEKASIRKGSNIKRSPIKKMRNKRQEFSQQQDEDIIYQCAELKNLEFAL